ncbi:protein CREG1-like [Atheta coriaria]|uniref:protein CREG1-like n=1 Tax=Dalotia coriaria TaxID=877792 RepID=UPI0031F3D80B
MHKYNAISIFLVALMVSQGTSIPKPSEKAKMGRYIIHNVDWISIATISTLDQIKSYPFVNLKSVADGPAKNGTGIPYLLMTDLDLSGRDVKVDNRVTVLASLAEVAYCSKKEYDPQDPRCGRLIITGKLLQIPIGTDEFRFAHTALITKHPVMASWEKVHKFYLAKIDIEQVCVLDYFGGASFVPVDEYLQVSPEQYEQYSPDNVVPTVKAE